MTHAPRWVRSHAALLLMAGSLCLAAEPDPTPNDVATLAHDNQLLRRQVELASSDTFYLLLDPNARTLSLMLHGVTLGRYSVVQVEVAERQVAYVSRSAEEEWRERVWTKGNLNPPRARDRVELKAPPPGADASEEPAYIPPPPEEAFPVPPRYGIRFEGGLYIDVHAAGGEAAPAFGDRIRHWWDDVKEALRSEPTDRIRLRVTLKHEDVQTIYRSLPPDCSLLVLPQR